MSKYIDFIKASINLIMTIFIILGIIIIVLYIIGIEPFVVESGSMEPALHKGSLCFINKHIKYENIKENDIIAFNLKTGEKVTHRVIHITDQGFETKGDFNNSSDGISTTKNNYIGKNIFSIPKLGYIISLTQTSLGKIILWIATVIILLSIIFLRNKKNNPKHAN